MYIHVLIRRFSVYTYALSGVLEWSRKGKLPSQLGTNRKGLGVGAVLVRRALVLLVAAMMAITLSFGVSATADASGYSSHGCKKYSQGYKSSDGKCYHKDMKDKKDKKKKKPKKYEKKY